MGHYISSNEASWRILSFSSAPVSSLRKWTEISQKEMQQNWPKTILYPKIYKYYTYKAVKFQGAPPTEPGIKMEDVLARVYTGHPRNLECFFLRLFLHHIRGPTSFQDLKTINVVVKDLNKHVLSLVLQKMIIIGIWLVEAVATNFPKQVISVCSNDWTF